MTVCLYKYLQSCECYVGVCVYLLILTYTKIIFIFLWVLPSGLLILEGPFDCASYV